MTETKMSVRERLTEEILDHRSCGERGLQAGYLTIDFDLIVAARDKIEDLEKKLAELHSLGLKVQKSQGLKN